MILIPLKGSNIPLSQIVSFRVSPLYEMAASLHALAQISPPEPFAAWAEEIIANFHSERLIKEWEYFKPVFRYGISDVFDPVQNHSLHCNTDLYTHIVHIETQAFQRSLVPVLQNWSLHHEKPEIAHELQLDPDYVKGRFSLFLSSYWQLFFEVAWERITPLFDQEAEKIQAACQDVPTLAAWLQVMCPSLIYLDDQLQFSLPASDPEQAVEQLVLYPTHYYRSTPFLFQKGSGVHVQYTLG